MSNYLRFDYNDRRMVREFSLGCFLQLFKPLLFCLSHFVRILFNYLQNTSFVRNISQMKFISSSRTYCANTGISQMSYILKKKFLCPKLVVNIALMEKAVIFSFRCLSSFVNFSQFLNSWYSTPDCLSKKYKVVM